MVVCQENSAHTSVARASRIDHLCFAVVIPSRGEPTRTLFGSTASIRALSSTRTVFFVKRTHAHLTRSQRKLARVRVMDGVVGESGLQHIKKITCIELYCAYEG